MSALFPREDPETWRSAYASYWDAVEAKSNSKKPGKLLHLDKWYQEELPKLISGRPDKHVTQSELVKLMEWKLTRGKFRQRLPQLGGFQQRVRRGEMFQKAIAELCCLKGVGPATASAVLAAGAPEQAAFMSDEATESVPGLKPVQYTAKHYALYLGKMVERTEKLNKVDPQQDWTPHRLELCLWAWTTAKQHQPPTPEDVDVKASSVKKCPDVKVDQRPTKKLKTR
uniref:Zgc:112496 n=1 Tax=Gasterosteus aculeatus aculeatus TaxID=481459 RepID=A0AAQ4S0E0_GASAC